MLSNWSFFLTFFSHFWCRTVKNLNTLLFMFQNSKKHARNLNRSEFLLIKAFYGGVPDPKKIRYFSRIRNYLFFSRSCPKKQILTVYYKAGEMGPNVSKTVFIQFEDFFTTFLISICLFACTLTIQEFVMIYYVRILLR